MREMTRIMKEEVKRRMDAGEQFVFIDVRNVGPWERSKTKIKNAIRIPLSELATSLDKIPRNRPVVTYCT